YELAFRMQAAAPELIDLSKETQRTLDAYGLDRREPDVKADRGGGRGQYRQFAANCLLARRLVERGVRFVSLYHASWDHHSNLDNELRHNCLMADQPVTALLRDLKRRGLLDSTLVMWLSEFGRTPLGENRGGSSNVTGRDHRIRGRDRAAGGFNDWLASRGHAHVRRLVRGGRPGGARLGGQPRHRPGHRRGLRAARREGRHYGPRGEDARRDGPGPVRR